MCSKCVKCGNGLENAILLRTQFTRLCWYCGAENKWPLEKNQKPIGYSIDKERVNEKS